MAAAEQDLSNGRYTELIEPSDLIPLKQASEKFNMRTDTMLYRIKHNKLPAYIKVGPTGKDITYVSIADMEQQPPVDPKYSARGQKRPDVAERNKLKRKYNKKGTTNVSQPQEETSTTSSKDQDLERHICYAFGRVQAWLDIYAGGIGASPSVLTHRVGELLQSAESGGALGVGVKLSRL